ncbi:MAG: DUF1801 domain-containing protein [Trueperaceae bacterium]
MAGLKTKVTKQSVEKFLSSIKNDQQRLDALDVLELMQNITNEPAKMWGDSIIGFGSYHYTYKSGREGEWFLTGFSPRKGDLSIYLTTGFEPDSELLKQLGKHKLGKSCLYVKKLEDIKLPVLKKLIKASVFDIGMDMDWIVIFISNKHLDVQLSVITSDMTAPVHPNVSIEVNSVDELYNKAVEQGLDIAYPLIDEPWGVRHFFIRDRNGQIINLLAHIN